ncbi:MAG TPA: prepilin-type N-terminal cleavage/methylation domain-containing protein [Phycisphaerae bacterium]|nr:prepilin-type N-terminal cleavage/methylation domain-containing protein [Phycisphaerae bacterium]
MNRAATKGFTLVEILIVVIILGILAAIVIPQFTEASAEARVSNVMTNLQTIRSQLLLYKTQHLENYPADAAAEGHAEFEDEMTNYSDANGTTSPTPGVNTPYGPYLQSVPTNPISGDNTVAVVQNGATQFAAPAADGGWWFNAVTGEFRANLVDTHTTTDGTQVNEL